MSESTKKAVMYGAGKIGRAFAGKLLWESGYDVCFLDIKPELIKQMNSRGSYDIHVVKGGSQHNETIKNVRALNGETDAATKEIALCDIAITSVGVNNMKDISPNIARAIKLRKEINNAPLNIILAENQLGASELMKGYVYEHLDEECKAWADKNLGLVNCSVGRTVPQLSEQELLADPLLLVTDSYPYLPVDSLCFKGDIPNDIIGLKPHTPFGVYHKRKLFIHNMAHALCAYMAWDFGIENFWDAAADAKIKSIAKDAMTNVAKSLNKEYEMPMPELEEYIDGLLALFANRLMKDSVDRVAADPLRKIRRNDRLVGAALYVLASGLDASSIVRGLAAALRYDNPKDSAAILLQQEINAHGADYVINKYMGLDISEPLAQMIKQEYLNS